MITLGALICTLGILLLLSKGNTKSTCELNPKWQGNVPIIEVIAS